MIPRVAFIVIFGGLVVVSACDSSARYSRLPIDTGSGASGGGNGGDSSFGGTGGLSPGDGGSGLAGSSGAAGSGGAVDGVGGAGTGGADSAAGAGAGGVGDGSSGGMDNGGGGASGPGMGGSAVGGNASGGKGAGGSAAGGRGVGGRGGEGGAGGAGGAGMAGAGGAGGARLVLSIDFGAGNGGPARMAATETAGVRPAANWNSLVGGTSAAPVTPLLLSDGSSVSASVTWTTPVTGGASGIHGAGLADAPGDVRMMNSYLDPISGVMPVTVVVSDLPPSIASGGYDVYVYFLGFVPSGATRTSTYAIGTASFTVSEVGPTAFSGFLRAANMGTTGNYVVFRNVTGPSFTLTATPAAGTAQRAPVNGLQIVATRP